jgi:hypothetical protein
MIVLVAKTDDPNHGSLLEGVSDSDLIDGAGQVILELLHTSLGDFDQMEILDKQDLKRAVCMAPPPADEDERSKECRALLTRALRLLGAGYYRSLLLEEREKVGRISYRLEAMMRFKEKILKGDLDEVEHPGWKP